jgi:Na+/melibiose symporter-like transporter
MIYQIRRVNVWSLMKVAFVIFGILGVIVGIFYAIFFALMGQMLELGGPSEFSRMTGLFGGIMGVFAGLFLAIFYAVIGSLMTAFFAGLYNLLARGFGGIELHLEPQEAPPTQSPLSPPSSE